MSLDVYLTIKSAQNLSRNDGIYIREDGKTKKLTRAEWDILYPNRAPVSVSQLKVDDKQVYWRNITHNLNRMADEAGIYKHIWRPDEVSISKASQLIEPLRSGLSLLQSDRERFEAFNPPNGWGDYDGLVSFVSDYLAACEKYPDAEVYASR